MEPWKRGFALLLGLGSTRKREQTPSEPTWSRSPLSSIQGVSNSVAKIKQCIFLVQTSSGFRYIVKGGNPENDEEMEEALAEGRAEGTPVRVLSSWPWGADE